MQEKNTMERSFFCLADRTFVIHGAGLVVPSVCRLIASETDSKAAASHPERVILQGNFPNMQGV
jgi:hypothetical protein